jgi:hypothetical protein
MDEVQYTRICQCTGIAEAFAILPSNGETWILRGAIPYANSLWRQTVKDHKCSAGAGTGPSAECADWVGIRPVTCAVRLLDGATGCSLLKSPNWLLVPSGLVTAGVPVTPSAWVKRPECEAHRSTQSTADVKNDWGYTSASRMLS